MFTGLAVQPPTHSPGNRWTATHTHTHTLPNLPVMRHSTSLRDAAIKAARLMKVEVKKYERELVDSGCDKRGSGPPRILLKQDIDILEALLTQSCSTSEGENSRARTS